jgi:hypothetical protein
MLAELGSMGQRIWPPESVMLQTICAAERHKVAEINPTVGEAQCRRYETPRRPRYGTARYGTA